jgi:hypothetical protein
VGFWDRLILRRKVTMSGLSSMTRVPASTGGATWTSRPDLWPADADIGLRVINYVFKRMQIDESWSVRGARGFTWWGQTLAQRVWAEEPRLDEDMTVTKVHAETDLVKNVDADSEAEALVAAINTHATLSAAIWEPTLRRVSLHCTMFVHDENVDWEEELFTHAVTLQAADAHFLATGLADSLRGQPHETNHPTSGPRLEADEMLGAINNFFFTTVPSPYRGQDLVTTLRLLEQRFLADGDEESLVAEFLCADDKPAIMRVGLRLPGGLGTAWFKAETVTHHPRLGTGALLLLQLPVDGDFALAARLNHAERDEWTSSHLLGGWCVGPLAPDRLSPSPASSPPKYVPRACSLNCVLSMGARAKWAGDFLVRSQS